MITNGGDSSPNISAANSTKLVVLRSHRPKSVITELSNDEIGEKVNLDAPPMPSALSHISKCRPKPMRNFKRMKPPVLLEEVHQSHSGSENGENSAVYDTAANESVTCSPRESDIDAHSSNLSITDEYRSGSPIVARNCMLPPSHENLTNSDFSVARSPTPPLSSSVNATAAVAPPIVPRKKSNVPLAPPTLPPKPDQIVTVRPVSCSVDSDSRSVRKSVADMARLFSSTDAPFSRRS
ncbi:unnamed protein product [Onchocerca flexuosa]|uniref:CARMIL C-terminal domain-containing protein n=1 Tax=Onchocerca flexuosa TaxID=387005 RepID=A0A183HR49_9BILA|nr:unnamed protein product [Onchocerca flexuosa]